ncbi:hypothetical protein MBLNU457_1257t1 [Dothideomycetes sp. NU457]
MRAARYGFRILEQSQRLQIAATTQKSFIAGSKPWICGHCLSRGPLRPLTQKQYSADTWRRSFSVSLKRHDDRSNLSSRTPIPEHLLEKKHDPHVEEDKAPTGKDALAAGSPMLEERPVDTTVNDLSREARADAAKSDTATERAAEETMPSDVQKQRWDMSKRFQVAMDTVLAKAATAGHRVNQYTGTDYSGIEALRQAIIAQEQTVKAGLAAVAAAKDAYTEAHTLQTNAQKEVVGLLERKHSWAGNDLERYMSLIRSEHVNEQAVAKAREELADSERMLENARSELERKERKQYHEEQIWSDTIRRNSTWVTFGLMGLNIFLLLANLAIFEPWRRRRLVREVRTALEEKTISVPASPVMEREVERAVEPANVTLEQIEEPAVVPQVESAVATAADTVTESSDVPAEKAETVGSTPMATGEVLPEEAVNVVEEPPAIIEAPTKVFHTDASPTTWEYWEVQWAMYKERLQEFFSERTVTMKRVELTTIALESVATGLVVMGVLLSWFSPR